MILCKSTPTMKKRAQRTISISIEEMPKRPEYIFKSDTELIRFIKKCEMVIRTSLEYRQYIKFLKENMDYNRCAILRNIVNTPEKHYTIEVHHSPFTLFDIVQTVVAKYQLEDKDLNVFQICQEVMQLHYDGKVGLIPLTATQHQLVHSGKIFIPLNLIYQDYVSFVDEYEPYMLDTTIDKITAYVEETEKHNGKIIDYGGVLDVEFGYLNVDGFDFPIVPEEWGKRDSLETVLNASDPSSSEDVIFRVNDELK